MTSEDRLTRIPVPVLSTAYSIIAVLVSLHKTNNLVELVALTCERTICSVRAAEESVP